MNLHSITATLIVAGTFALASTAAVAADAAPGAASQPATGMTGMGDMSKHPAMTEEKGSAHKGMGMGGMGGMGMGGDMKGMMGMMKSCPMMGHGQATGNAMSLRLPPGNEKLQFQMQAEMMQKMGEIAAKYADRIQ